MEVCRLCLDLQSDNNYLPLAGNYKDMVQVVAPELNLEISNAPVVCNECSSNLDELFVFKTKCFENEEKIRPKCENNKNKFRLKQVLDGTTDVEETALKPDKTKDRVCRTCMEPIESESFTILKPSEPDAYLDSMLTMCLNDIDLELTKDPVICESCMDNLQKLHHFKSTSLDVEDKLTNFCETHGTNSSEQINLNSVLEYEISKTDADSGFVNVKVENYEDESEDASMKSEMGSEMTVDSELKQEEIDIKSEAGTSSDKRRLRSSHDKDNKEKWLACKICPYKTKSIGVLKKHTNKVHESKSHKCPECDYKSAHSSALKRHVKSIHEHFETHDCSECDYQTFRSHDLKKHLKFIHKMCEDYECAECDFKSMSKAALKKHIQVVHQQVRTHECSDCDFKTTRPFDLRRHLKVVHNMLNDYQCEKCKFKTRRLTDLKRHMQVSHEQFETHECTECNFKTVYLQSFRKHIQNMHKFRKKALECSQCSYKTSRPNELTAHIKDVHEKCKNHECAKCGFRTDHEKYLKRHVKHIHESKKNGNRKDHECPKCDFKTAHITSLKRHLRTQHYVKYTTFDIQY